MKLRWQLLLIPALFGGILLYWQAFRPRDPIGIANGVYSSTCCGDLILRDGVLIFGETRISYVVQHDKAGKYVLPERALGVIDGSKVAVISPKSADEIRLHDTDQPRSLTLLGTDRKGTMREYTFVEGR